MRSTAKTPPKRLTSRRCGHVFDRLWARLPAGSPDECWLWPGSTFGGGYGSIKGRTPDGLQSNLPTHRVAWESQHGPVPEGLFVCHRCDVRLCCNPDHLFLGTQIDNIEDACRKGRIAKGEGSGTAKLTEKDVREIRHAHQIGAASNVALARRYGIGETQVRRIVRGMKWKHLKEVIR